MVSAHRGIEQAKMWHGLCTQGKEQAMMWHGLCTQGNRAGKDGAWSMHIEDLSRQRWGMVRVGQNHIYTVYIRYFWQGNHQIFGHIRCIYMVLANPTQNCKGRV